MAGDLLTEGVGHLRTLAGLLAPEAFGRLVEHLRLLAVEANAHSGCSAHAPCLGGGALDGRELARWALGIEAPAEPPAPRCLAAATLGGAEEGQREGGPGVSAKQGRSGRRKPQPGRPAAAPGGIKEGEREGGAAVDAPPGLVLEEREGMGRVLVAAQDFRPGQALFEESSILTIPGCDRSGARAQRLGPLSELAKQRTGNSTMDLDALCSFHAKCTEQDLACLEALEDHCASDDFIAGKLAEEVAAAAGANGPGGVPGLARFLRVVSTNSHSIPQLGGIAIFFWLSMFAHSCQPNATCADRLVEVGAPAKEHRSPAITARPRALRSIAAGEVVSISYLGLPMVLASTPVRQELLRIQKNFHCACARCCARDAVRPLPSPCCRGAWCVLDAGPRPAGAWSCESCAARVDSAKLPLGVEEKVLNFILGFDTGDDEQTIHAVLSIVHADLGHPPGECEHFLSTWLLLDLHRVLERRIVDATGGDAPSPVQQAQALHMLQQARALHVLRELVARLGKQLPSCFHYLAMEALPVLRSVAATGGPHALGAGQLACALEGPLAAARGPLDPDVRLLGSMRARWAASLDTPGSIKGAWLVHCETCGAAVADRRRGMTGPSCGPDAGAEGNDCRAATWCSRCGLAAYCGAECEAQGRRAHAAICLTCDGLPGSE